MNQILENIKNRDNSNYFSTGGGRKLHYLKFGSGKTTLLIIPGMGEPSLKYWEIASDLTTDDRTVYVLDNYGHGLSDHPLPAQHSQRVYVEDFNHYIEDACDWYDHIKGENKHLEVNVLGHSMGGQIAVNLSHKKKVNKLILSCPMFKINTKGLPIFIAKFLARVLKAQSLAPLQEEYNSPDIKLNQVTQSAKRAELYHNLLTSYPKLKRFGVTNGWLKASLDFLDNFEDLCKAQPEQLTLLFSGGLDSFVCSKNIKTYAEASLHREYIHLENSKHEILMEKDSIRNIVIGCINDFLA